MSTITAGGDGGVLFSDTEIPSGARIFEIYVHCGRYVDSVQIAYILPDGRTLAGPRHGGSGGQRQVFRLDSDEHLLGISGRYGDYIDSIKFYTDKRTSPTYGGSGGKRDFRIEVPSHNHAIGFVGRAARYLDAIGLNFVPMTIQQIKRTRIVGGGGGSAFSDQDIPLGARISEIRIRSADYVDAVQFVYILQDGRLLEGPRHGGTGGRSRVFRLDSDEHLLGISGRYGRYIDSIKFHTDKRTSPTYGGSGGTRSYQLNAPDGNQAIGLAGRAARYLDAIGLNFVPMKMQQIERTRIVGGAGGSAFSDQDIPSGARISEIRIRSADYVDAVQFVYILQDGRLLEGSRHGGTGGKSRIFRLSSDEHLLGISGRYGRYIDSIKFHTDKRTSPTYGGSGGTRSYQLNAPDGNQVIGLTGRAARHLDAVGLIYSPIAIKSRRPNFRLRPKSYQR
jgi:hypothetical protein